MSEKGRQTAITFAYVLPPGQTVDRVGGERAWPDHHCCSAMTAVPASVRAVPASAARMRNMR
jgi:hypothetical protein